MDDKVVVCLRRLGPGQYAQAFAANDIDPEVLPELTADDLIALGITSIGHRRKLLAAIAALRRLGRSLHRGCSRRCRSLRRGRTPAADGNVLRPGWLNRALDAV